MGPERRQKRDVFIIHACVRGLCGNKQKERRISLCAVKLASVNVTMDVDLNKVLHTVIYG